MGVLANLFKPKGPTGPAGGGGGGGMNNNDPVYNEDLASMVNEEYQRRQAERMPFELQWRLNTEFINGNQYLDIDSTGNSLVEVPKFYWYQEREVFNQLSVICETRIARLSRQRPSFKVRPASGDDKDLSTAKISSMLLQSTWDDQEMNETYASYVAWLELIGTVLWKPVWNTRKGRVLYKGLSPKDPATIQDEQYPEANDDMASPPQADGNNPFMQDQELLDLREGDIETCVVPAHEFFPDSSYRDDLSLCRSVIHARAYHTDEIQDLWGVQVESEDVDVMTLQKSSTSGGLGYAGTSFKTGVSRLKNHAVVKEYYERASKKYPLGRFIVVVGNKTLHASPLPYMVGKDGEPEFPFIRTVNIRRPGCFWGSTVVERCIPIQRRYNALRNRKAEYLNLVAIGQWYEPEGTIDDDTELNNSPGNRIRYRPSVNGIKPEPVQFPSLPASFEHEEQTLMSEFTSISGVSELARMSRAPVGVKSGVALSLANEQDDSRVAVAATNIANSAVLLGKYWIRMYRQFVQEPRMLRSIGPNRDVEVRSWFASDLKSDDVFIENAAALSETPAQRRQMVFDLLKLGMFNKSEMSQISDQQKQKVFEMLEYGNWETQPEDMYWLQRNRARRENESITQGSLVPTQDFDDHALHIETHNRERIQVEFDQLLQSPNGQQIDQAMRQHIAMHQQAISDQQMAQMQQEVMQAQMHQEQQGRQGHNNSPKP